MKKLYLTLISIVFIALCAIGIYSSSSRTNAEEIESDTSTTITTEPTTTTVTTSATTTTEPTTTTVTTTEEITTVTTVTTVTTEDKVAKALAEYTPVLTTDDVKLLKKQNPDTAGWVYIKNGKINTCFMQSYDNDFYLHRNFNKEEYFPGSIFEDFRSNIDGKDETDVVLLYGHHMADESMFTPISWYIYPDYAQQHKYIEIATDTTTHLYQVCGTMLVYGGEGADFDFWNFIDFDNKRSFERFVANYIQNRKVDLGTLPDKSNQILMLQTCYGTDYPGWRTVVVANRLY